MMCADAGARAAVRGAAGRAAAAQTHADGAHRGAAGRARADRHQNTREHLLRPTRITMLWLFGSLVPHNMSSTVTHIPGGLLYCRLLWVTCPSWADTCPSGRLGTGCACAAHSWDPQRLLRPTSPDSLCCADTAQHRGCGGHRRWGPDSL